MPDFIPQSGLNVADSESDQFWNSIPSCLARPTTHAPAAVPVADVFGHKAGTKLCVAVPKCSTKQARMAGDDLRRVDDQEFQIMLKSFKSFTANKQRVVVRQAGDYAVKAVSKLRCQRRANARDLKRDCDFETQGIASALSNLLSKGLAVAKRPFVWWNSEIRTADSFIEGLRSFAGHQHDDLMAVCASVFRACGAAFRYVLDGLRELATSLNLAMGCTHLALGFAAFGLYAYTRSTFWMVAFLCVCVSAVACLASAPLLRSFADYASSLASSVAGRFLSARTDAYRAKDVNIHPDSAIPEFSKDPNFEPQAAGPLDTIAIEAFALLIATAAGARSMPKKGLDSVVDGVSKFPNFRKGACDVKEMLTGWFSYAVALFKDKVLDSPDAYDAVFDDHEVKHWVIQASHWITTDKSETTTRSAARLGLGKLLIQRWQNIVMSPLGPKLPPIQSHHCSALSAQIQKALPSYSNFETNATSRNDPIVIYLYGIPGVGKSYCVRMLIVALIRTVCPDVTREDVEKHLDSFIFSRCTDNEYWNGYLGQRFVVFDDIGQKRDVAGGTSDWFDLIRAANSFPFHLHMADIESKSNSYFSSPFIILTSNSPLPQSQTISCMPAVYRRVDIYAHVIPRPEFRSATARLDTKSVMESVPIDQQDQVYDFRLYEPNALRTPHMTEATGYTYVGVAVDLITLAHMAAKKHTGNQEVASNQKATVMRLFDACPSGFAPTMTPEEMKVRETITSRPTVDTRFEDYVARNFEKQVFSFRKAVAEPAPVNATTPAQGSLSPPVSMSECSWNFLDDVGQKLCPDTNHLSQERIRALYRYILLIISTKTFSPTTYFSFSNCLHRDLVRFFDAHYVLYNLARGDIDACDSFLYFAPEVQVDCDVHENCAHCVAKFAVLATSPAHKNAADRAHAVSVARIPKWDRDDGFLVGDHLTSLVVKKQVTKESMWSSMGISTSTVVLSTILAASVVLNILTSSLYSKDKKDDNALEEQSTSRTVNRVGAPRLLSRVARPKALELQSLSVEEQSVQSLVDNTFDVGFRAKNAANPDDITYVGEAYCVKGDYFVTALHVVNLFIEDSVDAVFMPRTSKYRPVVITYMELMSSAEISVDAWDSEVVVVCRMDGISPACSDKLKSRVPYDFYLPDSNVFRARIALVDKTTRKVVNSNLEVAKDGYTDGVRGSPFGYVHAQNSARGDSGRPLFRITNTCAEFVGVLQGAYRNQKQSVYQPVNRQVLTQVITALSSGRALKCPEPHLEGERDLEAQCLPW